jgi:hypothetical protein
VNHAIFSVHLYIFVFIAMLFLFGLSYINDHLNWGFLTYLSTFIILGLFFYQYKAMRNFYGQRRAKTVFKFILLNLMFPVVLIILFTVFTIFSLFKI